MTPDVTAIVKGLTKAQREAIKLADDYWGVYGTQPFRNRLALLGLCAYDTRAGRGSSWLLDLGLAVRDQLMKEKAR